MKKMHFALFFVVGCAFLFFSCEVTGKPDSTIPDLVEIAKSNDQGEDNDDQGGKPKPPIVKPPVEDEEKPPVVNPPDEEQPPFDIVESEFYIFGPGHLLQLPGSFTGLSPAPRRGSVIKSKAQMDGSWVSNVDSQSDWVIKKYNDNFFNDFNLVVVSLFINYGRLEIDSLTVNKKELNIFIEYMPSPLTVMAGWTILIPIGKEHFDGDVDDINIVNVINWPSVISPPKEDEEKPPVVVPAY